MSFPIPNFPASPPDALMAALDAANVVVACSGGVWVADDLPAVAVVVAQYNAGTLPPPPPDPLTVATAALKALGLSDEAIAALFAVRAQG